MAKGNVDRRYLKKSEPKLIANCEKIHREKSEHYYWNSRKPNIIKKWSNLDVATAQDPSVENGTFSKFVS